MAELEHSLEESLIQVRKSHLDPAVFSSLSLTQSLRSESRGHSPELVHYLDGL